MTATIAPPSRRSSPAAHSRRLTNAPRRLTFMTRSHSAVVRSSRAALPPTPALKIADVERRRGTRTARDSRDDRVARRRRRHGSKRRPAARIGRGRARRHVRPASRSCATHAAPMPLAPPVTIARAPSSIGAPTTSVRWPSAPRPTPRGTTLNLVTAPLVVGVPREVKTDEHRVAITPDGVAEMRHHDVQRPRRARRRRRLRASPTTTTGPPARRSSPTRRRRVGPRRPRDQGEGAASRRSSRSSAPGLVLFTYLHLAAYPDLAPRTDRLRNDRRRVRDGAAPERPAAAARADERGRRAHGAADRRALPRTPPGRARRAARRRARRAARARRGARRGQRRVGTRRGSRRAWRPRCSCSTRTSTACAGSTRSTRAASRRSRATGPRLRARCATPTSSSARCSFPAAARRCSSATT